MDKDKVATGDSYKQIVIKRMINLCWFLLLVCFIIKLFGGNFFAFVGESQVANYICNNVYLLTLVQFVFYFIGTYINLLIVFKDRFKVLNILFTLIMFCAKALCNFGFIPAFVAMIVELVFLIIIPVIINKKDWYLPIIVMAVIFIFQYIAMFTKNIGLVCFPDNALAGFVFMIDYYIMLLLSYLYLKKERFTIMMLGVLFLSSDVTQLEAYKGILKDKYEKKVAKIDAKIKKLNEKK